MAARLWLCLWVAWLVWQPAQAAGFSPNPSQTQEAPIFAAEQIIELAKKVEKALAQRGARVAIIGRIGRPPEQMPEGMYYTHAAFAVYSDITTQDGRHLKGYATFNEYQSDAEPDTSSLVQDYPVDFYASVARLEAGVIIPSPELQRRLLEVIASPTYAALHEPSYSAIANPYTLGKQNCTEFVLDVIQAAIYGTSDLRVIKAQSKQFFQGQQVHVNGFKLLLGSLFSREISLSDHPSLPPVTATFETLARYLQQYDQAEFFTLKPD
ncbi:DUF2145 domain-containing protein [Malikia spinosa]|jgi:hypothetical protein|uniref:DUF2145 domain-containing protein n=1 Tax=Malikia spinosa TaxID=86180 RepID=UPI0026B4B4F6|nr:DUF2145 domain-containing protein [Malikia spinosa]